MPVTGLLDGWLTSMSNFDSAVEGRFAALSAKITPQEERMLGAGLLCLLKAIQAYYATIAQRVTSVIDRLANCKQQ